MNAEEHDVSRDFQRFLDSAAIELDVHVFNDLIFDLSLLWLQFFYAPLSYNTPASESFQSSWPHYEFNPITNVEKSASLVGISEVQ